VLESKALDLHQADHLDQALESSHDPIHEELVVTTDHAACHSYHATGSIPAQVDGDGEAIEEAEEVSATVEEHEYAQDIEDGEEN
jgi:phage terminase large subunit-like protein